ncbi:unnamed protein product [Pleuronectes platessa]|uniref:Uncharacterized protein n=1 Tax=Pleuronectes platessa TaxID=8262 RepID=A0A9N7UEV3_PLEPL|nr:unnamed protein product [Pleuronectes platessa]
MATSSCLPHAGKLWILQLVLMSRGRRHGFFFRANVGAAGPTCDRSFPCARTWRQRSSRGASPDSILSCGHANGRTSHSGSRTSPAAAPVSLLLAKAALRMPKKMKLSHYRADLYELSRCKLSWGSCTDRPKLPWDIVAGPGPAQRHFWAFNIHEIIENFPGLKWHTETTAGPCTINYYRH